MRPRQDARIEGADLEVSGTLLIDVDLPAGYGRSVIDLEGGWLRAGGDLEITVDQPQYSGSTPLAELRWWKADSGSRVHLNAWTLETIEYSSQTEDGGEGAAITRSMMGESSVPPQPPTRDV